MLISECQIWITRASQQEKDRVVTAVTEAALYKAASVQAKRGGVW